MRDELGQAECEFGLPFITHGSAAYIQRRALLADAPVLNSPLRQTTCRTTNMTAKTEVLATPPGVKPHPGTWLTAPRTLAERQERIEVMGQRIGGYIQFMGQVATLNGTSAEAKERAVTAFYERMVIVEGQLRRIQEALTLE